MAAKTTAEAKRAKRLVLQGKTPYAAAKATGITPGAIYKAKWYQEYKKAQEVKNA